mmetsp:Transcript_3826/g.8510  ORF Transcript_3826/g.8510 Transcript_3826/m.8510 type:complete len:114 (+) Transcript_3826:177-518(+)
MDDLRGLGNLLGDDRSAGSNESENGQEKLYFGPNTDSTHEDGDGYHSDNSGNRPSSDSELEEGDEEDEDDVKDKAGDGRASGDRSKMFSTAVEIIIGGAIDRGIHTLAIRLDA